MKKMIYLSNNSCQFVTFNVPDNFNQRWEAKHWIRRKGLNLWNHWQLFQLLPKQAQNCQYAKVIKINGKVFTRAPNNEYIHTVSMASSYVGIYDDTEIERIE